MRSTRCLMVAGGAALAFCGLLDGSARADEVKLKDGQVLRGEITGGDEKVLKLKHTQGSEVALPWDKIASAESDKPVELKTLDGSRILGKLKAGESGVFGVQNDSAGVVNVPADKVIALNEPPEKAIWSGKLAIGATIQDGNTRGKTFFGAFDGDRKTKQDRIEAHAFYTYAETKDPVTRNDILSARKSFVRVQYSYYVLNPLYVYAGGAFDYDYLQNLRLRSRGGAGLGYSFVDEPDPKQLRVEGGAEFVNEDFRRGAEDRDFTALRAALYFDWQLTSFMRVSEAFEIFPNTRQFSDFFCRSVSSLNLAIIGGLGFAGVIIWEHDQKPSSPDLNKNDTTYILTLTYTF